MIRKSVIAFTFVFVLACAAIFSPVAGSQVQAQQNWQNCKAFHAFVQGSLPTTNQFAPTDTWGGPIFVNLDSGFLQGGLSGNDGTEYPHGPVSIFKGGEYKLCLTSASAWGGASDCLDSFPYKVPRAVVVWPAGNSLAATRPREYCARNPSIRVCFGANGDRRPIHSLDRCQQSVWRSGRWNGEFSGRICGVQ